MKTKIFLLFAIVLLLSACRGTKSVIGSETANSSLQAKEILSTHIAASPKFNTMAGRIKVEYEDEKKSQSMTVSLRMEKDKKIWIKASLLGITLAKVFITPERVSYYETLSNTYFDGDFSLLSEWLGTEVDFEKTQAILLGQTIFETNSKGYSAEIVDNKYKLSPKRPMNNFVYSMLLNPDNFKLAYANVKQPVENRLFEISYGPYQNLEGSFYPSEVAINSMDGDALTRIEVTYRKIDLNVSVSFPFTIPNGYEPIDIGR